MNNRRAPVLVALCALTLVLSLALGSCGAAGKLVFRSSLEAYDLTAQSDAATEPAGKDGASGTDALTDTADDGTDGGEVVAGDESEPGILPPDVEGEISTPLMWRVEDKKTGGVLYLLGSMHAGLDDMCLFPDEVYAAFDECRALAVECDVIELENDVSYSVEALRLLVYTDGSKITDHVDAATYKKAVAILEENSYPSSYMDYYCPALWQQVIDEILTEKTPYEYEKGVDRYFLNEAKRLGKVVFEVEDVLDTYRGMAALSERTQAILLEDEVDEENIASYADGMAKLYEMWKRGDPDEIDAILLGEDEDDTAEAADTSGADSEAVDTSADDDGEDDETEEVDERAVAYEEYNKMMLGDRNVNMIKKAREYLKKGIKVFYVVGLAHMVGDDGIVAGLTDLGYEVERVEYGAD